MAMARNKAQWNKLRWVNSHQGGSDCDTPPSIKNGLGHVHFPAPALAGASPAGALPVWGPSGAGAPISWPVRPEKASPRVDGILVFLGDKGKRVETAGLHAVTAEDAGREIKLEGCHAALAVRHPHALQLDAVVGAGLGAHHAGHAVELVLFPVVNEFDHAAAALREGQSLLGVLLGVRFLEEILRGDGKPQQEVPKAHEDTLEIAQDRGHG